MIVLILGGSGMLGHKLVQKFSEKFEVWTTIRGNFENYSDYLIFDKRKTFENIEAENYVEIEKIISEIQPDVVINAIGIIKQLPDSKDVIQTLMINSIFPHRLALICNKFDARLICISTDCVFTGKKGNYKEEDITDAYDLYGKSKQLGEVLAENSLTIRTSIIGRELKTSHSLLEWFLSQERKTVKGYSNAVFSGFPTTVLSDILAGIIQNHQDLRGLYHISSEPINKFDLLQLIKKAYNLNIEIEEFADFKIDRSLNSDKFRLAARFQPLSWEKMIEIMANDPTPYDKFRK